MNTIGTILYLIYCLLCDNYYNMCNTEILYLLQLGKDFPVLNGNYVKMYTIS